MILQSQSQHKENDSPLLETSFSYILFLVDGIGLKSETVFILVKHVL